MTHQIICDGCGDETETTELVQVRSSATHESLEFCSSCAGVEERGDLLESLEEGFDVDAE